MAEQIVRCPECGSSWVDEARKYSYCNNCNHKGLIADFYITEKRANYLELKENIGSAFYNGSINDTTRDLLLGVLEQTKDV